MTQTKLGWPPHASRGKQPWRMASAAGTLGRQSGFSFLVTARRKTATIVASFPAFPRPRGRRYIFPMPAAEKTIVIGSSNGWLMLEGELSRVQAFNPLRKAKVFFPPSRNRYFEYFWSIKKAVFAPPKAGLGRNNSPALVAILRVRDHWWECSELAFAAAGDDVWTYLVKPSSPVHARRNFHDIMAQDGKLYALDERSNVLVFDLEGEKPSSSPSSSRVRVTVIKVKPHSDPRCMKRLAVISGELILVQWRTSDNLPFEPPTFEVFRLRPGPQKRFRWLKTGDLAGHAILHSNDGVLALPVEKYREVTADCIYSVEADETNDESAGLTVTNIAGRVIRFERTSTPASCFLLPVLVPTEFRELRVVAQFFILFWLNLSIQEAGAFAKL